MRTAPILLGLVAALFSCADLTPIPVNSCGNGVIDATEDCDGNAPNCSATCRFTCTTTKDCPTNWGCGTDKTCREKTGTFDTATAAVSTNAFSLLAGDFDADGRIDVVGEPPFGSAGSSRVHYFDRTSALAATTTLDLPIPIGVVKNIDNQGGDDIGFAVRGLTIGAFGALAGQRDRSFSTIVFPSVTLANTESRVAYVNAAANITLPGNLPSCGIGLGTALTPAGVKSELRSICGGSAGTAGDYLVPSPFGVGEVYGQAHAGRVRSPPAGLGPSACGQVVFATAHAIQLVSPCRPGGNSWSTEPPVAVPFKGDLLEDVYVGKESDLVLDDVIIHTTAGFFELAGTFVEFSRFEDAKTLPLASGDIDGDGQVDFVFPNGISLTTSSPFDAGGGGKRLIPPRDQLRWSAARIGRFNNDDLPDVLVSFVDSLDVDVMGNGGGGRFSAFTVRSDQVVRAIGSGDFDGDRIDDVAFLQSAGALDSGQDVILTLAFGSAVGAPETPRTAGKFKNVRTFGSLRGTTAPDNLAVIQGGAANATPTTAISVLFGSSGRQLVAPLFMAEGDGSAPPPGVFDLGADDDPKTYQVWQPASFSIGAIGAANTLGVFSIATGFKLGRNSTPTPSGGTAAWVAFPNPDAVGGLNPFTNVKALDKIVGVDPSRFQNGSLELGVISTVGDLTVPPDGIDEIISMARLSDGSNQAGIFIVSSNNGDGAAEPKIRLDGINIGGGDSIALFDLDRDGALDLVYLVRGGGERRALNVLRGDGRGGFVTTPATYADSTRDILGFAKLDAGATTKIAIVTDTSLSLVTMGADAKLSAAVVDKLGESPSGVTAVVSGDIDGDGVPDLAIAQGGGIRVLRQMPGLE